MATDILVSVSMKKNKGVKYTDGGEIIYPPPFLLKKGCCGKHEENFPVGRRMYIYSVQSCWLWLSIHRHMVHEKFSFKEEFSNSTHWYTIHLLLLDHVEFIGMQMGE